MSIKLKIFNCHHEHPSATINTELFTTLISNFHNSEYFLGDLNGINIASENTFSEMRHQYYVWKNLLHLYDYVGFEHYRRLFFTDIWNNQKLKEKNEELLIFRGHFIQDIYIPYLCASEEVFTDFWNMRKEFDNEEINALTNKLCNNDITLCRPLFREAIDVSWINCLPGEYWDCLIECVYKTKLAQIVNFTQHMHIQTPSYANMYIMRSDIFSEYMTFFFEVIDMMREQLPDLHRIWGHCAERLVNIFCYLKQIQNPKITVSYMPFILKTHEYIQPITI